MSEEEEKELIVKLQNVYAGVKYIYVDYQPMIQLFGNILVQVDACNYQNGQQGDTIILIEREGKYGILTFGWGSCSGCDALQYCNSITDVAELYEEFERSIKWFDYLLEVKGYVMNKDWSLEWYNDEIGHKFTSEVVNLINTMNKTGV